MVSVYNQGDIIEVDFNPTKGHEPANKRPALVVSSYDFNISNSMTIICPISNREKDFFLHEPLPNSCEMSGSVIMEQVRAIDLGARPTRLICALDRKTLEPILVCLQSFFNLDAEE